MKAKPLAASLVLGLLSWGAWGECYHAIPERIDGEGPYTPLAIEQVGPLGFEVPKLGLPVPRLAESEGGFAFERLRPQYCVGDTLVPPEGVDWAKTWDLYQNTMAKLAPVQPFVMDPDARLVYPTGEGVASFAWVLADGTAVTNTYVVGGVAENARPLRVYQTDDTRIVQPVKLDNRYARIFGSVAECVYGPAPGMEGMDPSLAPSNSVITYGTYIDTDSNTIYAKGAVTGKGVIVFYDSIQYRKIIAVRVIDVRQAVPTKVRCAVGEVLTPYGAGHPTGGLRPSPLQAAVEEPRTGGGPYLYQHKGADGFSPHDGDLFALRPCAGKEYKVQVWWNETDEMGIEWPFEFVEYEITWPERMVPFLRSGDEAADRARAPLVIPPAYAGEVTAYQEVNGSLSTSAVAKVEGGLLHAWGLVASGIASDVASAALNDVRFLLKLTGDDNVWFVPVALVHHGDTNLFDTTAREWDVGRVLRPRGGAFSGLADDRGWLEGLEADLSVPAYLVRPAREEDDRLPYAVDLYGDVRSCADVARGARGLPSEIAPVHTNDVLEAWWSCSYAQEGMPAPVAIPLVPQRYRPVWPLEGTLPQIVLASAEGSACTSEWCEAGALVLGASNTCLRLPRRPYLEDEGTLEFRYRSRGPDSPAAPGDGEQVLSFLREGADGAELRFLDRTGTNASPRFAVALSRPVAVVTKITVAGRPVMVTTWTNAVGEVELRPSGPLEAWHHVAVVESANPGGRTFSVYLDGTVCGSLEFAGTFAGAGLPEALVGCTDETSPGARTRAWAEIGEIRVWNRALTNAVASLGHRRATAGETGLFAYLTFEEGTDLGVDGSGVRTCVERTQGRTLAVEGESYLRLEGPPTRSRGVIASDSTPAVYRQPKAGLPGCNPNEEHAFVRAGDGGYVAWALRCDLNNLDGTPTSEPIVLVEYERNGRALMQAFEVVATNALYPAFAGTGVAGTDVPGPHPFDYLSIPNMTNTAWTKTSAEDPIYRDRTLRLWFRCAGGADVYKFYPAEEAFDFPDGKGPGLGKPVPWMRYWKGKTDGKPTPWRWTVEWPPEDSVPKLRIGQTLHRASDGLAEVWNCSSLAVLYPDPTTDATTDHRKTVMLFDPTVARTNALERSELERYGFTLGEHGNLTQRGSKLFFSGLPPTIADRFYYDTEKSRLEFIGRLEEPAAGATILYVNVLSPDEVQGVRDICTANKDDWEEKVVKKFKDLKTVALNTAGRNVKGELETSYDPKDHYALAAMGMTNWVTMIENDGPTETKGGQQKMVNAGDPITMRVFRVVPEYYTGRTVTRQDPYNLLSQQLSVMYTESFAGSPDDFEFEWRRAQPLSNGNPPEDYARDYARYAATDGPRFTLGANGSPLSELVNTYYVCRYRVRSRNARNEEPEVFRNLPAGMKTADGKESVWSAWCEPPAFAEGWVQRVLNNVTPFTQRMTDLYNNKAETAASMVAQAGRPWNGNVAMNQENLTSVGLIQLYQTLLNVAESMSTMKEGADAAVCQQLLLAAERLCDLYTVLGDDAFSDAMDPTIGFGTSVSASGWAYDVDIGFDDTALFSFDNQLRTLLDEELCLLRGRSGASAPDTHTFPVYNRLVWNMTRGITAGEVAYAVNYDARIRAANGAASDAVLGITADDAAVAYPQGHGDAYGHYLSALDCWIRLLRNPNFDWPRGASAMNVGDFATAVDYYDESKFAAAAAALARTAAEVVDRTARAAWRDNGGACGAGYLDTVVSNAFGYGEWAVRGGYGALCNWAIANSLLPADPRLLSRQSQESQTSQSYQEQDLSRIDRGTVTALEELCSEAEAIRRKVDTMDAGLNPLGLSESAVPFDITPIGLNDGTKTHYEQVRERAGTALKNAKAVLARAQEASKRLRQLAIAEQELETEVGGNERDWDTELVAIFGKPYPADVGPTGTYRQGYEGPDYYHYMWMDLSKYGLSEVDKVTYTNITLKLDAWSKWQNGVIPSSILALNTKGEITWEFSRTGIVIAPDGMTSSVRPVNGEIQLAYAQVLAAYANVQSHRNHCSRSYQNAESVLRQLSSRAKASFSNETGTDKLIEKVREYADQLADEQKRLDESKIAGSAVSTCASLSLDNVVALGRMLDKATDTLAGGFRGGLEVVAAAIFGPGVAAIEAAWNAVEFSKVGIKAAQAIAAEVAYLVHVVGVSVAASKVASFGNDKKTKSKDLHAAEESLQKLEATWGRKSEVYSYVEAGYAALHAVVDDETAYEAAVIDLQNASEALSAIVNKGTSLMEKREMERTREVSAAARLRYHDMFLRLERDAALRRYSGAFDLAQKYTFLTAKAYGYETGTSLADGAGAALLAGITGTRSLGAVDGDGNPVQPGSGDAGLAGVLAQLDANWLVEKGQLGLNNPQPYATWFSVRKELLQILDGEAGDAAWRRALRVRRVDDLNAVPEYARLCQPVQSDSGSLALKEPGLVIEFPSTIDFARNFFGNDLVNEGSAFDSSYFATKIAAAGVFLENYNAKVNGYSRKETVMAETPVAYLVPAGLDRMRAPGQDDGEYQEWNVLDQVIPAPYAVGPAQLDAADWFPAGDGATGGADALVRVRRYPSFRAYGGEKPTDAMLDAPRLAGRSVWNTRWLLIIPAGALNADRDAALDAFIDGADMNHDGTRDVSGVTDIKIGFKTYSHGGR